MIARLLQSWRQLGANERRLVLAGALVLLPIGLYLYAWQPLSVERAKLAVTVERLRGELAVLRAGAVEAGRLQSLSSIAASGNLRGLAEITATRFGLAGGMSDIQAIGTDQLSITFDSVPFDAWLRWAGELGTQGIGVAASEIKPLSAEAAGIVRVTVTLKQAAAR